MSEDTQLPIPLATSAPTPTLSQYFAQVEPAVCRIFAEAPEAAFFDSIGSSHADLRRSVAAAVEADRRRDAWIPTERTRQVLIASATSAAGGYFPDRELLTMPGVALDEELNDPVFEMMIQCLGEAEATQRKVLGAGDVTQDERGLRELIQAGCYRSAVNLTGRLLTIYGQGAGRAGHPSKHSPHSLQLWFTRLALLVKAELVDVALMEAQPFGQLERADVFYQFYPEMYPGRSGSMAPFSFRLLLAELPMHCDRPAVASVRLLQLLATIRQMLAHLESGLGEDGSPVEVTDANESGALWRARRLRVLHSIINCALLQKDFNLATDMLQSLLLENRETGSGEEAAMLSTLGRSFLLFGDVLSAERCFKRSQDHASKCHLVDEGLLAVAQNAFADAFHCFQRANQLDSADVTVINNMAVCLLYTGKLKEAIALLENSLVICPARAYTQPLVVNLCTLYDMESSRGRVKKATLLKQLAKHKADVPADLLKKLQL